MNPIKILLLFFTLLFIKQEKAVAQNHLDSTCKWEQKSSGRVADRYLSSARYSHTLNGDTTINQKEYFKVYQSGFSYWINIGSGDTTSIDIIDGYYGAIREESNSFFFLRKNHVNEYLLYDFNLSVGDSVECLSYKAPITNIDSILFNNQTKRVYTIDGNEHLKLIEGIGMTSGLFGDRCPKIDSGSSSLICYSQQNDFISLDSKEDCSFTPVSTTIKTEEELFTIYPNPTAETLNINSDFHFKNSVEFQIYSSTGQLYLKGIITFKNQQIDLRLIPDGIYFLVINLEGRRFNYSFIKD